MNCVLFACYLPSVKKRYVLEEIFSYIKLKEKNSKIFIGVQHNSISETEEILRKIKGNLDIEVRRVPEHMMIDSDASSFISALQLYSESDMDFDWCYFIHTKSITSNNEQLRKQLLELIFDHNTIEKYLSMPEYGAYAPFLTLTDVPEDIKKMYCMKQFNPSVCTHTAIEYYYPHTFYIIKNMILGNFVETVSKDFFNTNILTYSDRYMMERDFTHIVDMQGYACAGKHFHGNYSTNFKPPTQDKYTEKYEKWIKENQL